MIISERYSLLPWRDEIAVKLTGQKQSHLSLLKFQKMLYCQGTQVQCLPRSLPETIHYKKKQW